MSKLKLVILVRQDLKMDKGKLAVQVGHASVEAALNCSDFLLDEWRMHGMKKVVLKVKDKRELVKYKKLAKEHKLAHFLIKDAGRTFFKMPTVTCLAIGPDSEEKIDRVTGELKIL